ncbi:MAG: Asp23/Gls24 family envelope stress response protein [Truepera sp.]|jgi:uncharacterized alkaline shock family protein YloU|nr:Asp23/Gls24 family envelope stress response protein [Truepera sp.]
MNESSDLAISADVLMNITQLAVEQVDGVRPTLPPARVGEILGGRRARGIVIERDGDDVWVDLSLAVDYGVEIPKVAAAAQSAVREAIASMTGLVVRSVNVAVESVELPEEDATRG